MIKFRKIFVFFFVLLVFKAESQEIFQKIFFAPDGGSGNSIVQTNDGGFLIAGHVSEFIAGQYDLNGLLVKTDSIGNLEWNKTIGNKYRSDSFLKIIKTKDGNYVVLGTTGSCGPIGIDYTFNFNGDTLPDNISVMKIDSIGTVLWSYCYGDTLNDGGSDIVEDINGDLIITGTINYTIPLYDNGGDAILMRLDQNGILKWSKKIYSLSGFLDFGKNVCKGPNGSFYISGGIVDYIGPSINSSYILRTDSNGNVLWSKMIEDTIGVYAYNKMTDDNYGGVVFAFDGFTTSGTSGSPDIFILNFDSLGNIIWNKKYGNNAMGSNSISALLKSDNILWAADHDILLKIDLLTGNLYNSSFNFIAPYSTSIIGILKKNDGGIALTGPAGNPNEIYLENVDSTNNSCLTSSFVYPVQNFVVPFNNYTFTDSLIVLFVDSVYSEDSIILIDSTFCLTNTSIQEVARNSTNYFLWPNPFVNSLTISCNGCDKSTLITVNDITGRIVYSQLYSEKVNLDSLKNGIYVLTINSNKFSQSFKIIKINSQ